MLKEPLRIEYLGDTEVNETDFLEMIQQLSDGPFRYDLISTHSFILFFLMTFNLDLELITYYGIIATHLAIKWLNFY